MNLRLLLFPLLAAAGLNLHPAEAPLALTQAAGAQETGLKLSGSKTSIFQYNAGGGSSLVFTPGLTRRESLDLKISGQLAETIKVLGSFQQSDDVLDGRMHLLLASEKAELELGDLDGALSGSEFGMAGQAVSGAKTRGDLGVFGWEAVAALPKGASRFDRMFGNGTQGPYRLSKAPVVHGSEKVFLDKQIQAKGIDYELDHLSGQVVFKGKVISPASQIEVAYQSRDVLYERSLYGLQLLERPAKWLTLRQNYALESDNPGSSASIYQSQVSQGNVGVEPPKSRQYLGAVAELRGSAAGLGLEYSYQALDRNILTGDYAGGHAGRADAEAEIGPFKAKGGFKRSSDEFQSIGGAAQGSGLLEYGGSLDYLDERGISALGDWQTRRRELSGARVETDTANGKLGLKRKGWPDLGYHYFREDEKNGAPAGVSPSAGAILSDHGLSRHLGSIAARTALGRFSSQVESEDSRGVSSQRGVSPAAGLFARAVSASLGYAPPPLKWLAADLSGSYKFTEQQDSVTAANQYSFDTRTLNAMLSLNLGPRLALVAQDRLAEDSRQGQSHSLENRLTARPWDWLEAEGNYGFQNLQMQLATVQSPGVSQNFGTRARLSPWEAWEAAFEANQRETRERSLWILSTMDRRSLASIKWEVWRGLSLEGSYAEDSYFLANTADPALSPQTSQTGNGTVWLAKFAPLPSLSLEANFQRKHSEKANLSPSGTGFDTRTAGDWQAGLGWRTSMSERLRWDGSYSLAVKDQKGSSPAPLTLTPLPQTSLGQQANLAATQSYYGTERREDHTLGQRLSLDLGSRLTAGLSGDYNHVQAGTAEPTQTFAGGATVAWRGEAFNAEAGYRNAQSLGGQAVLQHAATFSLGLRAFEIVSVTFRGEYAKNENPSSEMAQATLSVTEAF